jgi:hypothetical protein
MIGKFNVMNMSDRDMILLGKPWFSAMNPNINWAKDTLQHPATKRSEQLKEALQRKWGLPPILKPAPLPKKRTTIEEEDPEKFAPMYSPLPKDRKCTLE